MPKAGRFKYPENDLDLCIERLRMIRENAGGKITTRAGAIQAMNMKEGGQAYRLLSSMGMYDLIESSGQQVKVTELGDTILYGVTDDEKRMARHQAIMKVGIFQEIHKRFGRNPTHQQLMTLLKEQGNIDAAEIAETAASLGKIFKKNIDHILSAEGEGAETVVNLTSSPTQITSQPTLGGGALRIAELKGVIEIRPETGNPQVIPLDDIDYAEQIMTLFFQRLKKKPQGNNK